MNYVLRHLPGEPDDGRVTCPRCARRVWVEKLRLRHDTGSILTSMLCWECTAALEARPVPDFGPGYYASPAHP